LKDFIVRKSIGWLAAAVLCIGAPAQAADAAFLKSFAGNAVLTMDVADIVWVD
jgi:hypothetical protein